MAALMALSPAAKRVQAARTALVLDQPFWGVLALQLQLREDPTCETAWVDGRTLGYSPAFVAGLTDQQLQGLICHEVLHCACGHPWRRGGRDHRRFNIAADYAINPIVQGAGMALPEGALIDPQYSGQYAEWIYDRLPEGGPEGQDGPQGDDQAEGDPEEGDGDDDAQEGDQPGAGDQPSDQPGDQPDPDADGDQPGAGSSDSDVQGDQPAQPSAQPGEVRDAPADADAPTEADWKETVKQAERIAAAFGQLPGGASRGLEAARAPEVDWREPLHRFAQEQCKADYSWARPNPRYLASGLFLPALHSVACGHFVVAVDTSGSVDATQLTQVMAEVQAIADELQPARIDVILCDAEINSVATFERGDVVEVEPGGGGGTAFGPVFDHVEASGDTPAVLIYLTDLEGSFPAVAPDYPVLWAVTNQRWGTPAVPFGEVLKID